MKTRQHEHHQRLWQSPIAGGYSDAEQAEWVALAVVSVVHAGVVHIGGVPVADPGGHPGAMAPIGADRDRVAVMHLAPVAAIPVGGMASLEAHQPVAGGVNPKPVVARVYAGDRPMEAAKLVGGCAVRMTCQSADADGEGNNDERADECQAFRRHRILLVRIRARR